jgi:uncharacterized membrane protein YqjE
VARGDELDSGSSRQLSGLEGFFANTNVLLLVFLTFCCNFFAIFTILGIVGLVTFQDPTAKQNAKTVVIVSAVLFVLGIIGGVANVMLGLGNLAGR